MLDHMKNGGQGKTKARVRYHCLAAPAPPGLHLGFDCLLALHQAGIAVRALSIGPAFLAYPPWNALYKLFEAELDDEFYVNIVCAPPNLSLGAPMRAHEVAAPQDARLARATDSNPVYRPQTALAGLHTVGVPNIAITMPRPKPPSATEIVILNHYDVVLCPSASMTVELLEAGVENADHAVPEAIPAIVSKFFR